MQAAILDDDGPSLAGRGVQEPGGVQGGFRLDAGRRRQRQPAVGAGLDVVGRPGAVVRVVRREDLDVIDPERPPGLQLLELDGGAGGRRGDADRRGFGLPVERAGPPPEEGPLVSSGQGLAVGVEEEDHGPGPSAASERRPPDVRPDLQGGEPVGADAQAVQRAVAGSGQLQGRRGPMAGMDPPGVSFQGPERRRPHSQLEIAVEQEVGRRLAADGHLVDGQAVEVQGPGGAEEAGGQDRVSRPRRDGDPLRDPHPAGAEGAFPRPEDPATQGDEPVAQQFDLEAGVFPHPLADVGRIEPDPAADDQRLGLPAIDAERPAGPGVTARPVVLEPEEMGADDPSRGLVGAIAEVVPALGDAVAVGVGLEVFERGRTGPNQLLSPGRKGQADEQDQGPRQRSAHGLPPAASFCARPVMGTKSVGLSLAIWTSLPFFFSIR